jgi:sugar phosphate isomerase/epimerase
LPAYTFVMFEPIPLSLGLSETPVASSPREALAWAHERGFGWVQVDAAQRGVRPRELDGSARRDLAAAASRAEVRVSGLDLWIPPEHFEPGPAADRAVSAVIDAVGLLGDLVRLRAAAPGSAVSLVLPAAIAGSDVAAMSAACERAGVTIADHAAEPAAAVGAGVDPALLLMAGKDPAGAAGGGRVLAARLSDANAMGRCVVGAGRLDVLAYAVALATAGWNRPVPVDVRGLPDPDRGIDRAARAWLDAGPG